MWSSGALWAPTSPSCSLCTVRPSSQSSRISSALQVSLPRSGGVVQNERNKLTVRELATRWLKPVDRNDATEQRQWPFVGNVCGADDWSCESSFVLYIVCFLNIQSFVFLMYCYPVDVDFVFIMYYLCLKCQRLQKRIFFFMLKVILFCWLGAVFSNVLLQLRNQVNT